MGADRRGPLAAFIILAIIAVILLVTSVRSQAAPGWFSTTVVAGPVIEPHPSGVTERKPHEPGTHRPAQGGHHGRHLGQHLGRDQDHAGRVSSLGWRSHGRGH